MGAIKCFFCSRHGTIYSYTGRRSSKTLARPPGDKRGSTQVDIKKNSGTPTWLPKWKRKRPAHLDGSYPGDSGFDPLELGKKPEDLKKYREAEVMHARWAMVGVLGLVIPDMLGVPLYLVPEQLPDKLLPISLVLLIALGFLEAYRGAYGLQERDRTRRVYPGRRFNPLKLADNEAEGGQKAASSGRPPGLGVWSAWLGGLPGWLSGGWWLTRSRVTEREVREARTQELKHGRLAMVSFIGVYVACFLTGKGPVALLLEHLADPLHHTVVQTMKHVL